MTRRSVVFTAAALAATALSLQAPPSEAVLAFSLADSGVNGSELNIGVSPNGSIFVGGWDSIARSTDDGQTWTKLRTNPVLGFAADRVLIVDKDTGRVMVNDTTLACSIMAWSDNDGASWTSNPAACGGGVTDHQKIAVSKRVRLTDPTGGTLYRNLMWVCANGLSHTDCGVSPDGGLTWTTTAPHGIGCAFQGAPVADADGVLYEPTAQCGLKLRRTPDAGQSWVERTLPYPAGEDTPDVAVTDDGTVYFFWVGADWKPYFARSSNGGDSWTGPFAVPVPDLKSSLFPSIVAGADGRIALSFYGTTDDAAGWNHNPGDAPDGIRWHGYVAVVTDADLAAPTVAPVQVTPAGDPLQYGCLSKLGGCLNNIADYADIDVGPDGRVYAVFTDGCLACANKAGSTAQRALVSIQTGGDDLRP